MDAAVLAAVEQALAGHDHVLLQAMEASKFGWKAPSDALLDEIAARWPGRVQIVADACQLRISRDRLNALLAKGMMVLIDRFEILHRPRLQRRAAGAAGLAARLAAMDRAPAGHLARLRHPLRLARAWAGLRGRFPAPLQLRPMAALGSGAGRDARSIMPCRAISAIIWRRSLARKCSFWSAPRRICAFLDGGAEPSCPRSPPSSRCA